MVRLEGFGKMGKINGLVNFIIKDLLQLFVSCLLYFLGVEKPQSVCDGLPAVQDFLSQKTPKPSLGPTQPPSSGYQGPSLPV
jgi:hypothetical protein